MKISEIDLIALNEAHVGKNIILSESAGNLIEVKWTDSATFYADHVIINGYRQHFDYVTQIYIIFRTVNLS